jgi:hypothetical protein
MYLFDNELFAIECVAKYAMEGRVVDSSNGQFAHCPEPKPKGQKCKLSGDKGYWLTFEDHQHQGLLQSVDFDSRHFWSTDVGLWLDTKPPGYGELYVIYKHYISGEHNPMFGVTRKAHSEKMSGENNPQYGKTGALSHNSKAIIAIKPDGTKRHFVSVKEAAEELRINRGTLCSRYLKLGHIPKKGKFKNWQFFFAEQK